MAGFLRLDRNAAVQRIHHRQNGLIDFGDSAGGAHKVKGEGERAYAHKTNSDRRLRDPADLRRLSSAQKTGTMGEVRQPGFPYIELSSILDNRSETDYIQGVKTMLENLKAMNFNTVYVHASAFTDAIIRRNTIRRRNTSPARSG